MKQASFRITILLLAWCTLNVSPRYLETSSVWLTNIPKSAQICSLLGSYAASCFEIFLLWLIAKFISNFFSGKSKALAYLPFACYFAIILTSISIHLNTQVFLNTNQIRAFTTFTEGVLTHTSRPDLIKAVALLGFTFLISAFYYSYAKVVSWLHCSFGLVLSLVLMILFFFFIPRQTLQPGEFKVFSHYISNRSTAGVALFWSKALYARLKTHDWLELDLTPIKTPKDFANQSHLKGNKKNLIFISVEALRHDYLEEFGGDPRVLPTINQLSKEGISFEQARSLSNESSYSKVTALTGTFALKDHYRDTYSVIDYPNTPIYDLLKEFGYNVAYFSSSSDKWQNVINVTGSEELDLSFYAEELSEKERKELLPNNSPISVHTPAARDYLTTLRLNKWVQTISSTNKPFFSFIYVDSSHYPFELPDWSNSEIFQPHKLTQIEKLSSSFLSYDSKLIPRMKNRHRNSLNFIDGLVAKMLINLKELGIDRDTIILVSGDHGEAFGEHEIFNHASRLYDETLRVPMIFWNVPEQFKNFDITKSTSHLDIAPTILSLLELPKYPGHQGTAIVRNSPLTIPSLPIFFTIQSFAHEEAVILWPYKLIFDHRSLNRELFNIEVDPLEQENIWEENSHVGLCLDSALKRHRNLQLSYYQGDPIIRKQYFPPKNFSIQELNTEHCKTSFPFPDVSHQRHTPE